MIISAAKEVGSAVSTALSIYRQHRTVSKGQLAIIKDKINTLKTAAHMRNLGELSRTMIQEITTTQTFLDNQNLTGTAYEMGLQTIRTLSDQLRKTMEDYQNGI
jgi:hypothetical protein